MPPKKRPALSGGLAAFGFTAKRFQKDVISEDSDLPEASAMSTVSITDTAAKGQEQQQYAGDDGHEDGHEDGHDDSKDDSDTDEPESRRDGPINWTTKQWREWSEKNPWLTAGKSGLGCSVCKSAKTLLLTDRTTGAHISDAWVSGTVSSAVQKQLRKKIYQHRDSLAHKRAIEIADLKEKDVLPSKLIEQSAASFDVTASSFRSAYTVAKERMPYTKMGPVMKLNELNGAKVGSTHRSDHSCAAIVEHIAEEMKNQLVSQILKLDSRISLTLDESTIHWRSYIIIYLRSDVTGDGDVDNVFFDLVELGGGDAESLHSALLNSLYSAGLNAEFLKRNLISIATDGAAVLTGRQMGWVASSYHTVKAVLKDFPVLARHFSSASDDDAYNANERNKFAGLLKHLTSTGFLSDLAVMKDVLRELQGLSLKLQKRDTSLVEASRQIQQTMEVLTAMKEAGGKTEAKVKDGIAAGKLKNVVLRESLPKINRGQFYQSIIDSLAKRLPDSELMTMLKPLDAHFWPTERSDLVLFGDREVGKFAKLIGEPVTEAISDYRDWKLQGRSDGHTLKRLLVASKTVLPTSAECERGFSACNDTDDNTRNRLRAKSLTALLFVDLNGPPIERFNPMPFVKSWIRKEHRTSASWDGHWCLHPVILTPSHPHPVRKDCIVTLTPLPPHPVRKDCIVTLTPHPPPPPEEGLHCGPHPPPTPTPKDCIVTLTLHPHPPREEGLHCDPQPSSQSHPVRKDCIVTLTTPPTP
ncbi:uncharacterized protein LOC134448159 [Engraulis encrasicolus]|uniref:uncharacterized protein LOC134448159 n=1 Tax=Engraulis encrasicolus TaxID=184585 RepID=UPI002FD3FED2